MNIIEATGVRKSYGRNPALRGLDLQVAEGSLFALLGPNGAGKTTFLKIVLGLVLADAGSIQVGGISSRSPTARSQLAYLPERFSFFPFESVEGVLKFFGRMRGLKGPTLTRRISETLARLQMEELRSRKLKTLSKGQLQRTGLASLFMGECGVFLLDEPFSGLDPIGAKELKDILRELRAQGKTVFINSHALGDMEKLCDAGAILNKGECLAQGPMAQLAGGKGLEESFYQLIKERS